MAEAPLKEAAYEPVLPGVGAVEYATLKDTAVRFRKCMVEMFQTDYCVAKHDGKAGACYRYQKAKNDCLLSFRDSLKTSCAVQWFDLDKCKVANWSDPMSACREKHVEFQRCAEDA